MSDRRPANSDGPVPRSPRNLLVNMVLKEAGQRSMTMHELATELGVSRSYLNNVRRGVVPVPTQYEFLVRCSRFLRLPFVAILMCAGIISTEDFYLNDEEQGNDALVERALRFVRNDPSWAGIIPHDAEERARSEQLYIIWCYEKATGTRLLPADVDYNDLMQQLREIEASKDENVAKPSPGASIRMPRGDDDDGTGSDDSGNDDSDDAAGGDIPGDDTSPKSATRPH